MPPPESKDPVDPIVAVVGINGFLGNHVARAAGSTGSKVVGLRRQSDGDGQPEQLGLLGPGPEHVRVGDARSSETLAAFVDDFRPQILVVAAGVLRSPVDEWAGGYSANYEIAAATVAAVTSIAPGQRPYVVWVGSQAEYGIAPPPWTETTRESPVTAYGTSKLMATSLVLGAVRANAISGCVVRVPIIFGPGQPPSMFVSETICSALADKRLRMTPGEQMRRLVYAPDLAASLVDIGLRGSEGSFPSLLNAPSYAPMPIRRIADLISGLLPDKPTPEIGALAYRRHEAMEAWPSTDLAESLDLTVRTPLEEALASTVDWYRGNESLWRGSALG